MPARPPLTGDSSSSETVIDEKAESRMDFFQAKAVESMRYLVQREEELKEKDERELRAELKGTRVWRIGGIGLWAYSQDAEFEGKKQRIWNEQKGKEEWLDAARARTRMYAKSKGVKPLVMWRLVQGADIPYDALPVGNEADGAPLFAARAWFDGGLHLGKAGHHLHSHASISYGAAEHSLDVYEVLCVPDTDSVKWMTYRHGENATVDYWQAVEGGREANGKTLLVAKGEYENGIHPGKCLIDDDHACVGYGGGELWVRPFQVLAYSSTTRR